MSLSQSNIVSIRHLWKVIDVQPTGLRYAVFGERFRILLHTLLNLPLPGAGSQWTQKHVAPICNPPYKAAIRANTRAQCKLLLGQSTTLPQGLVHLYDNLPFCRLPPRTDKLGVEAGSSCHWAWPANEQQQELGLLI